jgi:hypothetical protein
MGDGPCIPIDRKQLLELYISRTLTEVEPSVYLYIANASFAATSGRGIVPHLVLFLFTHQTLSYLGPRASLTRQCFDRRFLDDIFSWVDHPVGQTRGNTLDGNKGLQGQSLRCAFKGTRR